MSFGSKVIAKVKLIQKKVKSQDQEVKMFSANQKVLPQEIHMYNMKALSLLV